MQISSTPVGTYTYDSQNQRTKRVAGGNTIHYVCGLNGLLYGEYDNSGNLIREYVYLNSEPLAQIDAGTPEVLTYLHTDHLGTPRFGTNTGGTQVWAANADAFGVGTPSGSVTVNLRMPGQYYDSESGLFYNWNRYYNPTTGRYISSDPIGLEGGLNAFLYAKANPVMYSDPEGLEAYPDSFYGPLPASGYWDSEMGTGSCGEKIPPAPPGVSVDSNIIEAKKNSPNIPWFYNQVRNKGPWDYKQIHPKYEDFGNFNYGATGRAFGFKEDVLRRAAGWANQKADPSRRGLNSPLGSYPYGDDISDQRQIGRGIQYYEGQNR